jgi:NAD(P)-dependent dehydrogenase (short-subunit alcohol dehydrogenase family)
VLSLLAEIAKSIPNAFAAPFDITDLSTAASAIDDLVARHAHLDCLVNNAAVRESPAFARHRGRGLPPPDRDQSGGAVRALPRGRPAHGGARSRPARVHQLDGGPQSFQGDPAYVASKGGLEALMRALAVELGDKGIAANAIAPGFFLTDRNAPFFAQPRIAELALRIPLQRFGGPTSSWAPSSSWPPAPRPTSHVIADGGRGALGRPVATERSDAGVALVTGPAPSLS